jgi:hypothetical protein
VNKRKKRKKKGREIEEHGPRERRKREKKDNVRGHSCWLLFVKNKKNSIAPQ